MSATLSDVTVQCADCGDEFAFTVGEQLFYAERGLSRPGCCPACRARRRSERNGQAIRAAENTGGVAPCSDGFGNYGGVSGGLRKSGRPATRMYAATCSTCGRATELPFEPRGNRPVYCRDCFNARRGR